MFIRFSETNSDSDSSPQQSDHAISQQEVLQQYITVSVYGGLGHANLISCSTDPTDLIFC